MGLEQTEVTCFSNFERLCIVRKTFACIIKKIIKMNRKVGDAITTTITPNKWLGILIMIMPRQYLGRIIYLNMFTPYTGPWKTYFVPTSDQKPGPSRPRRHSSVQRPGWRGDGPNNPRSQRQKPRDESRVWLHSWRAVGSQSGMLSKCFSHFT